MTEMTFLRRCLAGVKVAASVCGGWWSLMSGALSIPVALIALFNESHYKTLWGLLAYATLFFCACKSAWKNLERESRFKRDALFRKMVECVRAESAQAQQEREKMGVVAGFVQSLQPADPTGALIKFSPEIQNEKDLEWICLEFKKAGYLCPLECLRPIMDSEICGQWLPVLQEASRRHDEIKNQAQFVSFLATTWSNKEKWFIAHSKNLDLAAKMNNS